MGRHSAGNQAPFYRSVVGWFVPWLLIAAVVGVAVWLLVDALAGEEATRSAATVASPSPSSSATPSPTATEPDVVIASPSPERSKKKEKRKKPAPKKTQQPQPRELITAGINVQVLNGTSDTAVDDAVADRLSAVGFRIEAIDDASRAYAQTTVFWSYPEAQEAAEILAERYGWLAQPKPENLSDTVAIHVVVGGDEL